MTTPEERAQARIIGLMMLEKSAWRACCEYDGINPKAKAALFSKGNPFKPAFEKMNGKLREMILSTRKQANRR